MKPSDDRHLGCKSFRADGAMKESRGAANFFQHFDVLWRPCRPVGDAFAYRKLIGRLCVQF